MASLLYRPFVHAMTALVLAKVLVDCPELSIILSFEGVVRCMDPLRCLKDMF